jgi:hypothetical protein
MVVSCYYSSARFPIILHKRSIKVDFGPTFRGRLPAELIPGPPPVVGTATGSLPFPEMIASFVFTWAQEATRFKRRKTESERVDEPDW